MPREFQPGDKVYWIDRETGDKNYRTIARLEVVFDIPAVRFTNGHWLQKNRVYLVAAARPEKKGFAKWVKELEEVYE